ncbi:F-box protein At4g09920-like isoform X2 [Mercurialis annua]|uniref:F-box protein At4g09920-like isoform X2 n=1 Tax=Mercurialis annua TaxID=3986 RepID=UPI00215FB529|nr:F-box protein At4g09920-like isoform X2 [Mercurialis annua]
MDTSSPLIKPRHLGDSNVSSHSVDLISKLPDEVLTHILSYFTTKEAVATSILSKRWEYLWTLTTDLDFSDQFPTNFSDKNECYAKLRSFKDYVDRVIFYHGGSIIRKCHLHCHICQVSPNIYLWVCAVITCNIQELSIEGGSFELQQLPWRLFTCKTLVVLKISGEFMLDLPTHICYPILKILSLDSVVYMSDASMDRLFSGCPVLEELEIIRRDEDGVQVMKINTPSLKKLTIHSYVDHSENEHKIQLNTPCLEYLELSGEKLGGYSMNSSSSLVEAHIYGGCDLDLLNGISKVQHLVLNGRIMQGLHTIIHDHGLPTFNNLKKLELYVGKPVDWESLPDLLQSSPNLEVLVFPEGLVVPRKSGRDYYRFYWHQPDSVPECLLYHLKKVEIFNFVGLPGELYLVKYLLECGEVLECMNIHCFDFSTRPRMRKKMEGVKYEALLDVWCSILMNP